MTSRRASPKKKRSKRPGKPRTRQISNWLDFIRPRLDLYVTLPRGDQKNMSNGFRNKFVSRGSTMGIARKRRLRA
jgi:hypothetical protein